MVIIAFDQGVGYWKASPSPEYPFEETAGFQHEWLMNEGMEMFVVNDNENPTYTVITTT